MNPTKDKHRSALDNYDNFTGWDQQQQHDHQNILQQLRNNLNNLEQHYQKEPGQEFIKKRAKAINNKIKEKEKQKNKDKDMDKDKENQNKLPVIYSSPNTQHLLMKKGSFLVLKNRNILKEAIQNCQKHNKQNPTIHEHYPKERLKPRQKHSQIPFPSKQLHNKATFSTQNVLVRRPTVDKLVELPLLPRRLTQDTVKQPLQSCEFSDQRMVLGCPNLSGVSEHRIRALHLRKVHRNLEE